MSGMSMLIAVCVFGGLHYGHRSDDLLGQYACAINDVREGLRVVPLMDKADNFTWDSTTNTCAALLVRVAFVPSYNRALSWL